MADKLHFSLVSPERELFSGEVDHVVAPGTDGEFGVLPLHAPFMSTLKPGAVRVLNGDDEQRIFVRGGFADVTPDGLTILAEEAINLADIDADELQQDLTNARDDLDAAGDDEARETAQARVAYLETLQAAL